MLFCFTSKKLKSYFQKSGLILSFFLIIILLFIFAPLCHAKNTPSLEKAREMIWWGNDIEAEKLLVRTVNAEPKNADAHFLLGDFYRRKEKYGKAITEFKKAVNIQPDNVKFREMLGSTYLEKGDTESALKEYKSLYESGERSSTVNRQIGKIHLKNQNYNMAVEHLEEALWRDPDNYKTYLLLGNALEESGKPKDAIRYYNKAISLGLASKGILYSLANVYEELGKNKEAIGAYKQITQKYPLEKKPYRQLARLYRLEGNLPSSISSWVSFHAFGWSPNTIFLFLMIIGIISLVFFAGAKLLSSIVLLPFVLFFGGIKNVKMLEILGNIAIFQSLDYISLLCFYEITLIDPSNAKAWHNMGSFFERRGKFDRALKYFNKSTEIDPMLSRAWHSIGIVHIRKNDYQKAGVYFKKALELDDEDIQSWYHLGRTYFEEDCFVEAMNAAKHALDLENTFYPALDLLMEACECNGDLEFAKKTLEELISKDERNIKYLMEMGNVLLASGRAKESLKYFEESIEISPDSYEAWYNIGIAQREAGLLDNATVSIERATRISPDSPWLYVSFALTCMMNKKIERAEGILKKSLEIDPLSSYSHYLLGIILSKTDPGRARQHVEKALNFFEEEIIELKKPWHKANEYECIGIASTISGQKEKAHEAFVNAIKYAHVTPKSVWIFSEAKMKLTDREEFVSECKAKLKEIISGGSVD
ncbi:MAG: tetratricopeptide repeat protein [Candidatus Eremiobacteraeota bacterium]|nr:tetratricopeptide repeat protein [Candidatus Eremiobacteraeota bacterium]